MSVPDQVDRPDLKYPPFQPGLPQALARRATCSRRSARADVLLHHPFQSFTAGDRVHPQAARTTRSVVAIKQTVYRTGTDSELMEILIDAARSGKEVTVVVELMARFDEEANINWAARLEEVGAHVVYGVVGHKTHAKMALVVRREEASGKCCGATCTWPPATTTRAPRGSTPTSACSPANEDDLRRRERGLPAAHRPRARRRKLKHVWQSPFTLHKRIARRDPTTRRSSPRTGKPARIIAKMNALLEPQIIEALYARLAGRREDRPHRARRVRAAPGHRRACRRTSACARSSGASSSTRASSTSATAATEDVYLVERRLDGPQLLPPHRAVLPGARPEAQARA